MRWSVMAVVLSMVIGGCGTTTPVKPRQALPNDIPDMETHQRIEEERRAVHTAEVTEQATTNESEQEKPFDYEAYKVARAAREAAAAAERAAFNATLPQSPEGYHTWVLQSINLATCSVEGVSMYCVETNAEPKTMAFGCSDEDAERILVWFGCGDAKEQWDDWSRIVDKPFHVPSDVQEPVDALNYLLTVITHNGSYERPSAEAVRAQLIHRFGTLEIPDFHDHSIDLARWKQACKPILYDNIPFRPASDTDTWGREPSTNEALLAFQRELLDRTGIRVRIVCQKWKNYESVRDSHDYFVVLQNERGVEAGAVIDEWRGDLLPCIVRNGSIVDIKRSDDGGGGRR